MLAPAGGEERRMMTGADGREEEGKRGPGGWCVCLGGFPLYFCIDVRPINSPD